MEGPGPRSPSPRAPPPPPGLSCHHLSRSKARGSPSPGPPPSPRVEIYLGSNRNEACAKLTHIPLFENGRLGLFRVLRKAEDWKLIRKTESFTRSVCPASQAASQEARWRSHFCHQASRRGARAALRVRPAGGLPSDRLYLLARVRISAAWSRDRVHRS